MAHESAKPCLVEAGQGFSVLYRNRHLYSRYNPEKAVLQAVESLQLLPSTLVLAASPLLWYGMAALLEKLPADSFVLALEAEESLHELSQTHLLQEDFARDKRLLFMPLSPDRSVLTESIAACLQEGQRARDRRLPPLHSFRRAILLDMSGGSSLNRDAYQLAAQTAQNIIATFWKNRLTLTKFGRLYARNLFKNLPTAGRSLPFSALRHSVAKPILLFGAGESATASLQALTAAGLAQNAAFRQNMHIMAVDAALPMLKAWGLVPDSLVALESQLAIEKAYIGNPHTAPLLLCDLVSRPAVTKHLAPQGRLSFFLSAYTEALYLTELHEKNLLAPMMPPLGSVGLTATYLALQMRLNPHIPVFVTGLDFSFSLGRTHGKNAPAHTGRLIQANRLHPVENYNAAYRQGAGAATGKQGLVFTDKALSGYAASFNDSFSRVPNLFDAGESGLPLAIPRVSSQVLCRYLAEAGEKQESAPEEKKSCAPAAAFSEQTTGQNGEPETVSKTQHWFRNEITALERIKELLIYGDSVKSRAMSVAEELEALIYPRDYLYLHFPDGYDCKCQNVSFLKRVRSEIDFFLKDFNLLLAQ